MHVEEEPAGAGPLADPLHLRQGLVETAVGQVVDGPKPGRVVGDVLREPVVVGLDHGQVQVGVGVGGQGLRQAGSGVEHLGVDLIAVDLGQAGSGVVASGAELVVPDPRLAHGEIHARAGVQAEWHRAGRSVEDPRVALLETFHARNALTEMAGHAGRPHIGRLVDVAVRGDQVIDATGPAVWLRGCGDGHGCLRRTSKRMHPGAYFDAGPDHGAGCGGGL